MGSVSRKPLSEHWKLELSSRRITPLNLAGRNRVGRAICAMLPSIWWFALTKSNVIKTVSYICLSGLTLRAQQ